jgi:serine/threonine-protein kinase
MGVVWRGHDRATGAVYAIKVLQPEYAHDPAAVGRFVRERTALIAFRHPNVVTVHDMIVEGDQLALVMDLVPGGDVDELRTARGGRLAAAEAAALAAQIGDGLAAAHAAGIVHRDVKPANALLHGDRVLLADFGIALLAGHPRVTTEGNVLGTAAYLAPEVIAGQEPGPAGDVYALGVTLYELLSGQPPFTGNTAAILHSHGTVAPARVSGIADGLWNVTAACLAKDPRARPPAAHAAAALRALAAAPDNAVTAPQSPEWRPGPQLWPDPLQAVRTTAVTPAERPPLAGEAGRRTAPRRTRPRRTGPRRTGPRWSAPRWAAAGRRRTVVIAASVAAVALLATGAVALNAFGSGTSSQQQAQLAGAGWQASQSASAVAAHSHASARPGSSRASGSTSATGQPGSSPTPSGAKSGGKAKGSPSASSSARPTGSSGSTGSTGPGSSPSPSSTPSPSSSPSPSSTAVTDDGGLPILYASSGDQAHKCAIIGSAYDANSGVGTTVEGIVCADVLTATESGGYTARAQLEVYCQTTGGADVQCADAIAVGELANEPNGVVASTGAYQCGHSYGPCATGRNYIETGTYSYSGVSMSSCSSDTRTATDSWGLAVGGGSTKIELPGSDDWVSLTSSNADDGSNQSTGHNYICP